MDGYGYERNNSHARQRAYGSKRMHRLGFHHRILQASGSRRLNAKVKQRICEKLENPFLNSESFFKDQYHT